jgi:hypothetical protein
MFIAAIRGSGSKRGGCGDCSCGSRSHYISLFDSAALFPYISQGLLQDRLHVYLYCNRRGI